MYAVHFGKCNLLVFGLEGRTIWSGIGILVVTSFRRDSLPPLLPRAAFSAYRRKVSTVSIHGLSCLGLRSCWALLPSGQWRYSYITRWR